jgi:hypothetical protein
VIAEMNKIPFFILTFLIAVSALVGCTAIKPVLTTEEAPLEPNVFSNTGFDKVLDRFVNEYGLVDYSSLREDSGDLEAYYRQIATYSPDSHPDLFPTKNHKLAYWINAYNAAAIKTVLSYYPINSVLDVKQPVIFFFLSNKSGFFVFQRLTFGGKSTSLYYLENGVIRKRFDDPRIHFALNCAALGCPRLPRKSFGGEALDRQLEEQARLFLAEERNYRIDHLEKSIYLSSIFQWYEKDFLSWYQKRFAGRQADLLRYVALYLAPEKTSELNRVGDDYRLRFVPYDWQLNDIKIIKHPRTIQ